MGSGILPGNCGGCLFGLLGSPGPGCEWPSKANTYACPGYRPKEKVGIEEVVGRRCAISLGEKTVVGIAESWEDGVGLSVRTSSGIRLIKPRRSAGISVEILE